jgi:hypothetical protein
MGVVYVAANPKGLAGGGQPRAYMPSGCLRPQLSSPSQARGPKPPYIQRECHSYTQGYSYLYVII